MLFARNLETVRVENNLTETQFAEVLGLHRSTIKRIQSRTKGADQYNPTYQTLLKASRALKVDLNTLISRRVTSL